jgi:tRNA(Ile2) C34 agmatinyltransferase TiaS
MNKQIRVEKYGVVYLEHARCPACSSEVDKGGRLEAKRKKNIFLKCNRCKYTIHSTRALEKKEQKFKHYRDKAVGLK